jgi:hypothetical protein
MGRATTSEFVQRLRMKEIWKFVNIYVNGSAKERFDAAKYVSDFVAMLTRVIFILVIYKFWEKSVQPGTLHGFLEITLDLFVRFFLFALSFVMLLSISSIIFGMIERANAEKYEGSNKALKFLFFVGKQMTKGVLFAAFTSALLIVAIGFFQAGLKI